MNLWTSLLAVYRRWTYLDTPRTLFSVKAARIAKKSNESCKVRHLKVNVMEKSQICILIGTPSRTFLIKKFSREIPGFPGRPLKIPVSRDWKMGGKLQTLIATTTTFGNSED